MPLATVLISDAQERRLADVDGGRASTRPSIWWAMESAVLIGMAKPWVPEDWSLDWKEKPAEAAVSMPST